MKIACLLLAYLPAVVPLLLPAAAVIARLQPLSPIELFGYAFVVSFWSGWSAGWRYSAKWTDWLKTACNTSILGGLLTLATAPWTLDPEHPTFGYAAIGISGLISLGGLAAVEWSYETVKQVVNQLITRRLGVKSDSGTQSRKSDRDANRKT